MKEENIETSPIATLDENLQATYADICGRIQAQYEQNRNRLQTIIEEHRACMQAIEAECDSFWQKAYEANPELMAMPERLFIGGDGKSVFSGFPIPGVPIVIFDKNDNDEVKATDESDYADVPEQINAEELYKMTSGRIKEMSDALFKS